MEFSSVNTIWVLVGAALVFFMQAGFAMVETGFTRAKNAGNIIIDIAFHNKSSFPNNSCSEKSVLFLRINH